MKKNRLYVSAKLYTPDPNHPGRKDLVATTGFFVLSSNTDILSLAKEKFKSKIRTLKLKDYKIIYSIQ